MLKVEDLININFIPSENQISLSLLIDFYEQYLCHKIFIFTLESGEKIKLFFKGVEEIFHISGIEHIYEGNPMNGSKFAEGVKNGVIDFETLKKINNKAFKDYIDRICSMACIDTIIKRCEYLWYSTGKIHETDINVKYLLLKSIDGKHLHLGIDGYKKDRPYFARTLLITQGNNERKFIDRADERLRVNRLEIVDKDTNELIELIERQRAVSIAKELIERDAERWCEQEFISILKTHFENEMVLDELFQVGNTEDDIIIKNNKFVKRVWSKLLRDYLENEKNTIRQEIDKYDKYWSGKIVGESLRDYLKNEVVCKLENHLRKYICEYKND